MEPGRPPGLKIDYTRVGHEPFAPEEPLWQAWNTWLNRNGWQSTADRGPGGLRKYINYPLSQALLRARDTVRLARVFREQERAGRLSRFWDRDLLAVHLDDLGDRLPPSRLRALLQTTTDPRRFDAIAEAAYEVYAALDWNRTDAEAETGDRTLGPRRLSAGLYRTEDFFSDTITYWLYPRMPRWWNGQSLSIRHGQESHPLRFQRAGWFHPLWPVDLSREHVDIVEGGDDIKTLVLPERDFWILGHDPEDDSSDVLATWRLPTLGETFLLLCQGQYAQQLALLHQEGLLLWDHVAEVTIGTQVWYEYHECMVLSSEWSGILPLNKGCKELLQTLQPTTTAAIILEGGLLVPGQHVWLDGYGPRMRICGFEPLVRLRVINLAAPAAPMRDEMVKANAQEGELLQLVPGEYLLEAWAGNRCVARRTFRTLSWDTLGEGQLPCQFGMPLGAFMLRGACLDPNEP